MTDREALFQRWQAIIRSKAAEYEHKARGKDEAVTSPDLDTICNEMTAFLVGLESHNSKERK